MVITTEPTAVLVLYRLFVTSCMLSLGCSAAADTVECSACAPLDGQCPPGFVVSGDCNCVCGSEGNVLPIDRCDHLSCRAYLRSGYSSARTEIAGSMWWTPSCTHILPLSTYWQSTSIPTQSTCDSPRYPGWHCTSLPCLLQESVWCSI